MKVAVLNNKGGTGKTTIACSLALELGYNLITEEPRSPVTKIFPKNKAYILDEDASIKGVDEKIDIIFDFKGNVRGALVREVVDIADKIVIPLTYESSDDLLPMQETVYTIQDVEKINENIIIVINKCNTIQYNEASAFIKANFDYPIVRLNFSKGFPRAMNEGIGISTFAQKERMSGNYGNAIGQLNNLINQILS